MVYTRNKKGRVTEDYWVEPCLDLWLINCPCPPRDVGQKWEPDLSGEVTTAEGDVWTPLPTCLP